MDQVARINLVQTALLSAEGLWADEHALDTFIDFLKTDRVYEVAPNTQSSGLNVTTATLDTSLSDGIRKVFCGFDPLGFTQFTDPYASMLHRIIRGAGAGAYHDDPLYDRDARENTNVHHMALLPNGIERQMAMSTPLDCGEAMLIAGYQAHDVPAEGDEAFALLRLLEPAYTAGRRLSAQVSRFGSEWLNLIDHFSTPVLLFGAEGHIAHRSQRFVEMIQAHSFLEEVTAPAKALASKWVTQTRRAHAMQDTLTLPSTLVATPLFEARLRAMRCPMPFGEHHCLIEVDILRIKPARLAELTRREAEVAGHLAKGLSDKQIARELNISPHTIRRHVEQVLKKLGVTNRTQATAMLCKTVR